MPDETKKKSPLVGVILALVTLFVICQIFSNDDKSVSTSEPTNSSQKASTQLLTYEQEKMMDDMIAQGHVSVKSSIAIYVDPVFWAICDAQKKEGFTLIAMRYCAKKRGDSNNLVEIYDKQSGRKIARYDAFGFKVF